MHDNFKCMDEDKTASSVSVGDVDQLLGNADLAHTMARIGHDYQLALRQGLVELPGRPGRADDVVASLDDVYSNVLYHVGLVEDECLLEEDGFKTKYFSFTLRLFIYVTVLKKQENK